MKRVFPIFRYDWKILYDLLLTIAKIEIYSIGS